MRAEVMCKYEQGLLDFIAERLARMGMTDSGLMPYYAQRVDKQRPLTRYERELLDYLEGEQKVVHAGVGIGTLSVGLALQGSSVLGFELDERRCAAAVALKEQIGSGTDYELRLAAFPAGLRPEDDIASATLLFTNVAGGWSEDVYSGAIAAMSRFRRTILDLRLFGCTRDEQGERDALAARLTAAGLSLTPLDFRAANSFYVELRPINVDEASAAL